MELTFAWFWLVQLVVTVIFIYSLYKAFLVHKKTGKVLNKWLYLSLVLVLFQAANPIKINGTNSSTVLQQQSYQISNSKQLPEKVKDNSFERGLKASTKDITQKEIWR